MNFKSILSIILCSIATFNWSKAETADTLRLGETYSLSQVDVSAVRPQVASGHLHVVSVISSDEIKAIPAANVNELLENLPGLDVRTRGAGGVQADLSMRGGTLDQVVVLLNGVNITDPQTGHYSLDIPVDISMIDRIEVLKGTSMDILGLSAFAGAVNIVTGSISRNRTTASVAAGSYGSYNAMLGANYGVGQWRLTGSASYNRSEGYMANSDYEFGNLMLQAACNDSLSGDWNIQLGGQIKNYGANVFYSLAYPNQYEQTRTVIGSVGWERRFGRFGLGASVYNRTHFDHYELIRDYLDAPAWYTFHNNHLTAVTGINVKGAWYSAIGKTSVGVELRNEGIISNVLGDSLRMPVHVPAQDSGIYYTMGKNRLNVNYFAEQTFFVKRFSASVGFSGNWNTMFAHNFAFGINAGYEYVKGGNIFVAVSRSLRLPSFTDLYYKSAVLVSNPGLQPETSFNTELGINYSGHGFTALLSVYYRVGQHIVDWVKTPAEEKWHSVNHGRVDAMGGEVAVAYRYGRWLPKAEITYSFCHLDKDAGEYISKYALDYLRHKLTFAAEFNLTHGFGTSWQLSFQQRNGQYTDAAGSVLSYRPIWLLDGKVFWQNTPSAGRPQVRLFVEAANITDCHYYDYGGILQPGIFAKGGIVITI